MSGINMSDPAPRIPQITPEEWTDAVREAFGIMEGPSARDNGSQSHVVKTFAHHPELVTPFLIFNRHLLKTSTLPARLRQIAILRVGWTRRTTYVWSAHLKMSLSVGLKREDFEAVKVGADSPHWSELERNIVRAVDQLRDEAYVNDATWAALSAHLERRQMMDLLFTVGTYMLVGQTVKTLRVEREPDLVALAAEYGEP